MKQYILDRISDVMFGFIFILVGIFGYSYFQGSLIRVFISLVSVIIGIGFVMHSLTIVETADVKE